MKKIYINSSCHSTTINDNEVILNTETGKYHELNITGSFIWKQLKNQTPKNKILEIIEEYFDINKKEAEKEFSNFLESFEERGLITFGD